MNREGEDYNPPSESQRTSGTLQDNQLSQREQAEQVDQQSRYQIILNPKRYFKFGRVFMTLWAEPKGSPPSSDEGVQVESDHVKVVFREIRHFVVVRAKAGHCLCVPISTYRGQGTLKHTTQPAQDHAIIVVFGDEPQLQPGELELTKRPLRVICEDPTLQKLHPASRINFAKVYTIEYNIRVRTFGRIATESLPLLQKYFLDTIVGTRDADEDTLLHSKRGASRSPDQSARALDAEPFRTPALLPRWNPDATTDLPHSKTFLEAWGEQPASERSATLISTVPALATTSDQVYSTTTRGTTSHLSELAKEFIEVPFGDYGTCEEFIDGHPEIRDESLDNFQEEAVRLQRDGNTSQLRNCVEKLLLLRQISKMSDGDYRVFLRRMKVKDPITLKGFERDVNKVVNAFQAVAVRPHGRRTGPELVSSGDSRQSQVLASIRHAPEQSRYTDFDDSLSAPIDRLSVSTINESDSSWDYGAGGNNKRPPPATRHSTTGRRDTLSSVDDDSPLNLFTNNQPDRGAPSIVERKIDIRGTSGDREGLDPRYRARTDGAKFFTIGRVFAMLWHESAGAPQRGEARSAPVIAKDTTGRYGESVFSHIIRLAVVKENHGFCWCIPISTYNYQGVLKRGFNRQDQEAHAIIHMDNTAPGSTSEGEERLMVKKPIAVQPATPDQKLHIMSRLNFAKIYTVQWNAKVMDVGKVTRDSMPLFIGYWRSQLEQ